MASAVFTGGVVQVLTVGGHIGAQYGDATISGGAVQLVDLGGLVRHDAVIGEANRDIAEDRDIGAIRQVQSIGGNANAVAASTASPASGVQGNITGDTGEQARIEYDVARTLEDMQALTGRSIVFEAALLGLITNPEVSGAQAATDVQSVCDAIPDPGQLTGYARLGIHLKGDLGGVLGCDASIEAAIFADLDPQVQATYAKKRYDAAATSLARTVQARLEAKASFPVIKLAQVFLAEAKMIGLTQERIDCSASLSASILAKNALEFSRGPYAAFVESQITLTGFIPDNLDARVQVLFDGLVCVENKLEAWRAAIRVRQ